MKRLFFSICLCALLSIAATPAFAADPEDVARAEQLYQDAVSAFQAGEYSKAATFFHASWSVVPKPELLYNESVAWGLHGDLPRAREAARRARDADLPDSMAVKNEARLRAWEVEEVASTVVPRTVAEASPDPNPDPVTSEPLPPRSHRPIALAVGTAGVGLLLAAAGLELAMVGKGTELGAAATARDRAAYDDALLRATRQQTVGRVLLVTGSILTVSGVTLWLWPRKSDAVALGLGPGGVTVGARF